MNKKSIAILSLTTLLCSTSIAQEQKTNHYETYEVSVTMLEDKQAVPIFSTSNTISSDPNVKSDVVITASMEKSKINIEDRRFLGIAQIDNHQVYVNYHFYLYFPTQSEAINAQPVTKYKDAYTNNSFPREYEYPNIIDISPGSSKTIEVSSHYHLIFSVKEKKQ